MLRSLAARLSLSEVLEHHLGMPGRWAQETCIHGEALGVCDAFPVGARLEVIPETARGVKGRWRRGVRVALRGVLQL